MISRSIFAALALLCALAIPAHAQKTKAQLNSEIGVLFPDNHAGGVTPQILRNVTNDIVNSIMPTAPVVSGNLACFDGTTGLLKDCAGAPGLFLLAANNLSDVSNVATARTNLGVTATGADTTYPFRSNNLSDLGNAATARTNLGVTATGADTTYAFRSNNLSDLGNAATARTNLGLNPGTGLATSGGNLNLQPAAAGVIGGVNSIAPVSHQWINSISTAGLPSLSQPAFTDISGTIASGQVAGVYSGITGVGTLAGLTVTGSFTATGLVTNADLANPSIPINGTTCTLGAPCTITAAASSMLVGTTAITSGTPNGLLYDNAGLLGNLATANNGVLVTSASGVPSISTTLPSGLTAVGVGGVFNILSGSLTSSAGLYVGRTTDDGNFVAIGVPATYVPNSQVGDTIVRGRTNLLLSGGNGSFVGIVIDSNNTTRLPNTLMLEPPVGFNLGFDETQTLSGASPPAQTGTFLGYAANRILVNNNSSYAQSIFGLHVELDSTLAGSGPGNAAGFFHTVSGSASGGSGFLIGSTHYASAETNWLGGTALAPSGSVYALSPYCRMGGPGVLHLYNLTCAEFNPEAGGAAGSTIRYKSGIQITALANDLYQGTDYDAAVSVSNIIGTSPGWDAMLMLSNANGQQPINSAGSVFKTKGSWSATIANGFDLRGNYTITSCAFASLNFCVDGSGNLSAFRFNNVTITTPVSPATLTIASAKTLTASNTLTFTGIDLSSVNFGAGGTVLYGNQTITLSGDVTGSGTTAITTTLANIPTGVPAAGSILHSNIAAPSSPASGKVSVWTDSTDLRFHDKNSAGVIGTTVVADTGAANNYISAISAAGAITKSRPACATLSDSGAFCSGTSASSLTGTLQAAQEPAHTGDVTNSAGSLALTLATAQPAVHTWALAQTFTVAPVFTDQSGSRTALGLGTAATQNTGTSGATVPLLNGTNVFSGNTSISASGVAADSTLTINQNTGASVAPIAGTGLHLVGADAANSTFEFDAYAAQNLILARISEGTLASKTATASGRKFLFLLGQGWDNSGSGVYANGSAIALAAAELWSGSAHGSQIDFLTVPIGSTTQATTARFNPTGGLTVGNGLIGTDPGAGSINATGSLLLAGATGVPAGGTAGLGLKMSTTSNLGVFFGSGAPTLSAAQGSIYIRTDGSSTSTRLYINTNGSTTWTNVTTAL